MSILELKDISKTYDTHKVLENINFELQTGEFFSVVGPSGCGKTTLLRIIAGLEFPTRGEIFINEIESTKLSPQKRNIGIVFQNYALFPNMNVFENVAYGLEVRKLSKELIKSKVGSVLEKVRMSHKLDKNVTTLSGGEQQRVSLARVIVTEPSLLLFDEPLSNLDYALRLETRNEIKRLQKEIGITSVYVTHDQSEALALSDRVAVMNLGIVQQLGTPDQIYYDPANVFVAGFIGHANFFDKKLSEEIFGIKEVGSDELLSVFPEELQPVKCSENCNARIADVQFQGHNTEYLIDASGMIIKTISFSGKSMIRFETGELVKLKLQTDKPRILKK